MIKSAPQCRASNPAHGHSPQGVAAYHTQPAKRLAGPRPGGPVQRRSGPRAPGALAARSSRAVRMRDGVFAGDPVAVSRWQHVP
jgi:hypothetical protein